jgi:hypothetical protein
MEKYSTISTSSATAEILYDFVIDESQTTRRIFKAIVVENPKDSTATVSGYIIYQRKGIKNTWENTNEIKLSQLKNGEGVKFQFSCSELKSFFEILQRAYAIGNKGVSLGQKEFIIEEANRFIKVPEDRKQFIKLLLEKNYGAEIWEELISSNPDLAAKLSLSKLQFDREKALMEFQTNLAQNQPERYWQRFFENNTWIFLDMD